MKKNILIILSFPITLVLYILLFSGNVKYSEEIIITPELARSQKVRLYPNQFLMRQSNFITTNVMQWSLSAGDTFFEGFYIVLQ